MERATQVGYITHRSKHEKIIMHQPSWSYASSITQPIWRWRYQHGRSYARRLHHTPINTRKDYHASTIMIVRIKHNPTILALELSTWKELRKMGTSHTAQNTKKLSCINLHDRIKHNPTNLALELSTWEELRKKVTSHTDQYTKRLSCINLHDHTSSITKPS